MEKQQSEKMERFTFQLPYELKNKATRLSQINNISLAQIMRESLEQQLARIDITKNTNEKLQDSFFADQAVFHGDCPSDISANHDQYLYQGDA